LVAQQGEGGVMYKIKVYVTADCETEKVGLVPIMGEQTARNGYRTFWFKYRCPITEREVVVHCEEERKFDETLAGAVSDGPQAD
jgi:hypothetical protein